MRFIYMLRCADQTIYTGITTDLERRVHEHNNEKIWAKYTKNKRPVTLIRSQQVENRAIATLVERKIKKMSKKKKELIIAEKELVEL